MKVTLFKETVKVVDAVALVLKKLNERLSEPNQQLTVYNDMKV